MHTLPLVTQDRVRTSYRPTKVDGLGKGVMFPGLYFSQQRPRVPGDTWKWKSKTGVSVVQPICSLDILVDAERVEQNAETTSPRTSSVYMSEPTFRTEWWR